ncbi:MAG: glycosyltransferase [Acidimicrobiales bacterium]|nr:glycosyltransferase [Acidimicrobiales bacterium]
MTTVSLVHERITELGGSEKVVDELAKTFDIQGLFVPISDRRGIGLDLDELAVTTSPLQRVYRHDGRYSHLLPALPISFRSFDPGTSDAVIVSHHAFANRVAHSVRDRPVISYVHSPARWMWDQRFARAEAPSAAAYVVLRTFCATQRPLDRRAAKCVTRLLANSSEVAGRIARWWDCDAEVVSPPVDVGFFTPDPSVKRDDSFLYAGRLVGYKRPDIAIRAARRAGVRLIVAGDGREIDRCKELAGPETSFVGPVDDIGLRHLFRKSQALIFPGLEDFGMIPVEAQATGLPVIGLGQGGIRDTVIDGTTGWWVGSEIDMDDTSTLVEAFATALETFAASSFDEEKIIAHAEQFAPEVFRSRMQAIVQASLA